MLGIGFGAGVSAGTFTRYPGIEQITVCEIEPVIPPTSTRFFGKQDYEVYNNPKTHIVFDDARHYLLTTNDKFDIIASDPLDVFVKGTAAIYSKEYFESREAPSQSRRHVHSVRAALRERRAHREERAGDFLRRLPARHHLGQHGQRPGLRHGLHGPAGAAHDQPRRDAAAARAVPIMRRWRNRCAKSASSSIDRSALAIMPARNPISAQWTAGAEINRDVDLRLQYLGGWGINSTLEDAIYRQMLKFRQMPRDFSWARRRRLGRCCRPSPRRGIDLSRV